MGGRPRIALTAPLPAPALEALEAIGDVVAPADGERRLAPEALRRHVADADAIVSMLYDPVDDALLAAAGPQLAVVANVAVGYDNVDVAAARQREVVVTNTPGVLTDATADLALALLLAVTRRLGEGERLIRRDAPWAWDLDFMLGSSLAGKTLGIVGFGAIGRATARRARAFGMRIAYSGRRRATTEAEAELEATYVDLDELFAQSDVVSLHCPLTPETRHLVDAERLARMRPDAYLVNTARGPIVDEAALADALDRGAIAGAGLDVFEREPLVDARLRTLQIVVLLPHLGSATRETRAAMASLAARNVTAVLAGEAPPTPVPDSYIRERKEGSR